MAWTVEDENKNIFKVFVGDNGAVEFTDQITVEDVKSVAREHGIKNMGVRGADGEKLEEGDFPVTENVVIFQVNKAG